MWRMNLILKESFSKRELILHHMVSVILAGQLIMSDYCRKKRQAIEEDLDIEETPDIDYRVLHDQVSKALLRCTVCPSLEPLYITSSYIRHSTRYSGFITLCYLSFFRLAWGRIFCQISGICLYFRQYIRILVVCTWTKSITVAKNFLS